MAIGNNRGFKNNKRGGNRSFNSQRPMKKSPRYTTKSSSSSSSYSHSHSQLDSDSDSGPEETGIHEGSDSAPEEDDFFSDEEDPLNKNSKIKQQQQKKKNKHAPKETKINHRPVSVVRDIPGLVIHKRVDGDEEGGMNGGAGGDVRFDTAFGRSIDYESARKQYAFLDEYREREIVEMEKILKDKKMLNRMDETEIEEMKYRLQSTKSKLETLKKKDRERTALKEYIKKDGGKKFLTRAEKRKVLLVDRFENMNSKQKNKAIERKRKRKLGKEMRALEFNR